MLCNVKLIGKHTDRMVEPYDKALILSILDCVNGPYIFSMLLAFSGIFKILLSHHGTVSPLAQPSRFRYT